MKRYQKYKDSGVPWLGQIPEHWEVTPAYVLASTSRRSVSVAQLKGKKVAHFSIPNVQEFGRAVVEDGDTIDSSKMLVEGRSVLVSRLNPRKRTVAIADKVNDADLTVCSGEFVMFRAETVELGELLRAFFVSNPVASFIESLVISATKSHGRADPHVIRRMQVAVPPSSELGELVKWLSRQVETLDLAISSQERMIELLKERRSTIITQAVTKGLDPKAKMKDSGVPWLGQVPAHWEVKPLKFVAKYNLNTLPETIDPDTEISYIEVSDVSQELGIKSFECMRFADAPSRARRVVSRGEVIISTVRTYLKAIARVDHTHDQFVCSTGFCVVRPDAVMPDFAQYALASDFFMAEVISRSTGVSYPAINASDLVRVKIAVPPVDEQAKISSYLVRAVAELDSAINSQTKMIELLKERRSAIVTQAVTGQIDVS